MFFDHAGNYVVVRALLDSYSDRTYCSRQLVNNLGLTGSNKKILVKTMSSEHENYTSIVPLRIKLGEGDFNLICIDAQAIDNFPIIYKKKY